MAVQPSISLFHPPGMRSLWKSQLRGALSGGHSRPLPTWVWPVLFTSGFCVSLEEKSCQLLEGYSLQTSTPGPSSTPDCGGEKVACYDRGGTCELDLGQSGRGLTAAPLETDRNWWCSFWHKSAPLPCLLRQAGSWNRLFTGWSSM